MDAAQGGVNDEYSETHHSLAVIGRAESEPHAHRCERESLYILAARVRDPQRVYGSVRLSTPPKATPSRTIVRRSHRACESAPHGGNDC
jgi:hypothetical protein